MRLAIIVGSVRDDNTTRPVAEACAEQAQARDWQASVIQLTDFDQLFHGTYITEKSANPQQRAVLKTMAEADALLFVVPTYFKSMPGALKNFFDSVQWPAAYDRKLIGFIASNHKNQDFGAGHAEAVVKGMLTFFGLIAVTLHEIVIINPRIAIDTVEINRCLDLFAAYADWLQLPATVHKRP